MYFLYVPCKNLKEARKIGRALINENLAVCVNIIPKVNSVFRWKGKIEECHETLLLAKTTKQFEKVRKRIRELHSYEIPLVAFFRVNKINKKYLKWACTGNSKS